MTDKEILATADACGLMLLTLGLDKDKASFFILAFAKLVAAKAEAKEREACAKVCDGLADMHEKMNQWGSHKTADTLAQAIRARGEQA